MKNTENMKQVAARIEAAEREIIEKSSLPDEVMEKRMEEFAKKLDEEYRSTHSRQSRLRMLTRYAAAVICIAAVGLIAIPSAGALKEKIKGWNAQDEGNMIRIEYGDEEGENANANVQGHYTFSQLPGGYQQEAFEENEMSSNLMFSDGGGNFLAITTLPGSAQANLNKEDATCSEVTVRGNPGYLIALKNGTSKFVFWAEDGSYVQVQSDGVSPLTDEELLELAENVKFVE